MSTYKKIFEKNQYRLEDAVSKSQTWFTQQARLLSRQDIQPGRLISTSPSKNVQRIVPGEMYLFQYDAKLQDTLPYWDMYPLVFPFRKLSDGFIGLNMHYLPYRMRIVLLDRLMDFKTNNMMNENTRLKYSWQTIGQLSRFNVAKPCVHRYLINHVRSPFKRVDASDWVTALMLPVERFVGAPRTQIWTESMR